MVEKRGRKGERLDDRSFRIEWSKQKRSFIWNRDAVLDFTLHFDKTVGASLCISVARVQKPVGECQSAMQSPVRASQETYSLMRSRRYLFPSVANK
jgi:hypothetical protein